MKNNNKMRNYVVHEIPDDSFGKYSIMLLEELYNEMGINTYHNEFINIDNKDYSFYYKKDNAISISPRNYLEMNTKILDENTGKVARNNIDISSLYDVKNIEESLSMTLSSSKVKEFMEQIYAMYGVSAITSSNFDVLNDCEFVLDKKKKIQLIAKSDKLDYLFSDYDSYDSNNKIEYLLEMSNYDYDSIMAVLAKLITIDPRELIHKVEEKRKVKIPKNFVSWFEDIFNKNLYLLYKIVSMENNNKNVYSHR